MSSNIYLVIPTYNEKGNIEKLLPDIFDLNISGLHILVVDDNSPDGTGQIVEGLKKTYPNLGILHRDQKQGLGKAYLAGFKEVLDQGADLVLQMDADFSHDPKYIPQLLKAIANKDLVLGSRYIKGGGVINWNLMRRLISRFGNIYAQLILGLPYHDLTGGFKCYRADVLKKVVESDLSSLGYNFQIETTYLVHKLKYSIIEIPIVFTERTIGKSKFDLKIVLEGFLKVLALRFKK